MKNFELKPTKAKHLFRVVNLDGNWKDYYNSDTGQYKPGLTSVLDRAYPKGSGFYEALKKSTPEEWDKRLAEAGDAGDAIHQIIEKSLSGEKVNRATKVLAEDNKTERNLTHIEWRKYLSFVYFVNLHGVVLFGHEETVEHPLFAGTLDQLWKLTKVCGRDKRYCKCADFQNVLLLNDVKTGKGLYSNHKAQVAGLAHAEISHLSKGMKVETAMLLHLNGTDNGWSVKFLDKTETEIAYQRCLAAFTLDEEKPFDPAKIEEIPDYVELKLLTEVPIVGTLDSKTGKITKKKVVKVKVKKTK
jgi:hypothetical protein